MADKESFQDWEQVMFNLLNKHIFLGRMGAPPPSKKNMAG